MNLKDEDDTTGKSINEKQVLRVQFKKLIKNSITQHVTSISLTAPHLLQL